MSNLEEFYADAVVITNREGKIIYSDIYNGLYGEHKLFELKYQIGKKIFELYPNLRREESTIESCIEKGLLVFKKDQILNDHKGRRVEINSLNIPIIRDGEVAGVVELTQDISVLKNLQPKHRRRPVATSAYCENISSASYCFDDIITKNPEMLSNIEKAKIIANNTSPVLIYGETGTGKELFVSSIHNFSDRRDGLFIAQNCAALPETLFESILFGTSKGAFTGAVDKPGLFELADKGTLFLDEIHSMSINLQAKLLRVLQDGKIRRMGDSKERKVDVRIIASMNIEPLNAVKIGKIRDDLFYRLNVVSLKLIPLRDRRTDIPLYIAHFINLFNQIFKKRVSGMTNEVKNFFMLYNWPGNVREIQHAIEASVSLAGHGRIGVHHLPTYLAENIFMARDESSIDKDRAGQVMETTQSLRDTIENLERNIIIETLEKVDGNISRAADVLEISRQSLHYKLNKYKINQLNN